jgi:sigma-54 dependent transcriptional regulator, acetoin dehydrogenase operon transcriptional activator AcoR
MPSIMPVSTNPFFETQSSRIELARRRYFDEGISPLGVVSDAVFQSWTRCLRQHASPSDSVEFQPVTQSRTHLALQKNRALHEAWLSQLPDLHTVLGTSSCTAMLTDASGVLIGATCAGRPHEHLMPIATRLGVDLSEPAVGTTAPGLVARTGQAVCVFGAEHFFDEVRAMNCAAAPIRDLRGNLAGVLDISTEVVPFNFDAAAVVGLFAGAIENRLLVTQSGEHLVVYLQVAPSLLDSPLVGIVGVDADGRLAWTNGVAARLLGLDAAQLVTDPCEVDVALGVSVDALASLPATGSRVMQLPSGLTVWARASMQACDGRRGLFSMPMTPVAAATPVALPNGPGASAEVATASRSSPANDAGPAAPASSLREIDRDLIARTLKACHGNVSRAAKQLRVSRGLIYRRMRELQQQFDTR